MRHRLSLIIHPYSYLVLKLHGCVFFILLKIREICTTIWVFMCVKIVSCWYINVLFCVIKQSSSFISQICFLYPFKRFHTFFIFHFLCVKWWKVLCPIKILNLLFFSFWNGRESSVCGVICHLLEIPVPRLALWICGWILSWKVTGVENLLVMLMGHFKIRIVNQQLLFVVLTLYLWHG